MSCGKNSRRIERKSAKQPEKNSAKAVSWSSGRPVGEFENEPVVEETTGPHPPALQDQLGFGSHDEGSQLEHPAARG